MKELRYQVRYALPLWFINLMTAWLPENRVSQRIRGSLISRVIDASGPLYVASRVVLVNVERLQFGSDVYIGPGVWINALGGVQLGSGVMMGPYSCVASTEHGFDNDSVRGGGTHVAPVAIGAGTWIGAHAVIAAGVRVGRGNLVAANAVVTRDTPPNVKVGGVPGRILSQRSDNPGEGASRHDF